MVGLVGLTVVGVASRMVQPWDGERLVNPLGVGAMEAFSEAMFGILSVVFAIAVVAAVVSVVLRFRRGTPADRSALRWLAVVAILAAALLVTAVGAGALGLDRIGDPFGVAFLLVVIVGLPATAAAALLTHRLAGIEVVANRSVVYGSIVATITVIYAAIVAGIGAVVGRSERSDVFAAVAATAVAAVAFQPARRRAQRFADRLIYGDRASPYDLVATFTERLDDASLSEVLPRMTTLIADGTGADRIRIWLRSDSDLDPWHRGPPTPFPRLPFGSTMASFRRWAYRVPGPAWRGPARRDHRGDAAAGADDPRDRAPVDRSVPPGGPRAA